MLEVQKYLLDGGTLDGLHEELGIKATHHGVYPLVILNYSQIESPKTHPIVRECRSLVLEKESWDLVSRSFRRFYNLGERGVDQDTFDFKDFIVQSKEDGSLCSLFSYKGEWIVRTKGTFGDGNICEGRNITWESAVASSLGRSDVQSIGRLLDPRMTYVGEFCSPMNKVVRAYEGLDFYLLSVFEGVRELSPEACDAIIERMVADGLVVHRPDRYHFTSIDQIQEFLKQIAKDDPTFEGVVIRDRYDNRFKIKNPEYLLLHTLRGNGDNLYLPKNLLPFILRGEEAELLTYFPEVAESLYRVKSIVLDAYISLIEAWVELLEIDDQKDFAFFAQSHQFYDVLFQYKKRFGNSHNPRLLREIWSESESEILKRLFKR